MYSATGRQLVGPGIGAIVGAAEGRAVGSAVGARDGAGVGSGVTVGTSNRRGNRCASTPGGFITVRRGTSSRSKLLWYVSSFGTVLELRFQRGKLRPKDPVQLLKIF